MATALINGQPTDTIAVTDRGFHYGDGLFETIGVFNGHPRFWPRHMARLQKGCARLNIPLPDSELLLREVESLSQGLHKCIIKIIVSRGSGGRGYRPPVPATASRVLIRYPFPGYPANYGTTGVTIRLCNTTLGCNPALAGVKHLNRLEQVIARCEWDDDAIAEGLMSDRDGHLIEGTMSNLFLVHNGELMTPDLSCCGVEGIMRGVVMELAHAHGIPLTETTLDHSQLRQGSELFLTNSLIGIWPVVRCEEQTYPVGPITTQLQHALAPLLESPHG